MRLQLSWQRNNCFRQSQELGKVRKTGKVQDVERIEYALGQNKFKPVLRVF